MSRFLAVIVLFLFSAPAYSLPQYLDLFRKDPLRNPNVDGCTTCHMSPQGGDARNPFGQAFESANYQISAMMRAQFPDRFVYPVLRASDSLTVHFTDPDKKQVVIETAGMKNLVDLDRTAVNGVSATTTTSPTRIVTPEAQTAQASEVPVDRDAREGAFFGANVVNLPNGKPQKRGGFDFFIGHRFSEDVKSAGLGGLFGFDSGAVIDFGIRAGITDRLSVSAYRSNFSRTISLGSELQITRQDRSMPVTLQARGGVDGINNFGIFRKGPESQIGFNRFEVRQYSPWLQVVATRTFKDRLSFTAVPIFAFNTRDENRVSELSLGAEHNNTISIGLGAGFRFLPSASVVGEYIPRVWGFKSEEKNTPGVSKDLERFSIGVQKSTFRHTFELLISRQRPMTPALYSFSGVDTFQIGFNIYRKIR